MSLPTATTSPTIDSTNTATSRRTGWRSNSPPDNNPKLRAIAAHHKNLEDRMLSNLTPRIAYDDLRQWLSEAERLGEVRTVRGANWQEDIGLVAEAILRAENGPCVVFEDVEGS